VLAPEDTGAGSGLERRLDGKWSASLESIKK